ncbi:auxin-responsive protein SAUR67-like [Olea europaea var. sylvestris]|uniref:auxin-responsive protein SAUR67-like n=1 Tax=Olea europaea var. sylvestris TaxID=158386 RepID=UPI000C1D1FF4|nr:auxin-responsive protein SAUR67-like [Olea europaea var. sylvestris]
MVYSVNRWKGSGKDWKPLEENGLQFQERTRKLIPIAFCTYSILPSLAEKGHLIVYTTDKQRYAFLIAYLNNHLLRELLIMSEEELDYQVMDQSHCLYDDVFLDYAISLIQKNATKDVEEALLLPMAADRCSSASVDIVVECLKMEYH